MAIRPLIIILLLAPALAGAADLEMKQAEALALETSRYPAESLLLESYAIPGGRAYFAVSLRGGSPLARKALTAKQYADWKAGLRRSLKTENEKGCADPFTWTLTSGAQKSEYSFCPGHNERMKSLDKTTREIVAYIRGDKP
jgi:hypothetical protein